MTAILKINYSNSTIVQQAQNYTDIYRILSEYVDNSIDDSEKLYINSTDSYSRNIKINISKSGTAKKTQAITITDNASGYKIDPNETLTIFDSLKRSDPKTNGMFGMGMFSFLAICNKMMVESKISGSNNIYSFEITNKTFEVSKEKVPEFELKTFPAQGNINLSYTKITLKEFLPGKFEEIDLSKFKTEVESHFELILKRKNISINFQVNSQNQMTAEYYDYSKVSTTNFTKSIDKLYKTKSKKFKTKTEINISKNPCKILLAVSKNMELNREPVFVYKGRRVIEVSKVDQFRTNNRTSIWSNPNVTGYIDVTGILEPVPTRKDFKCTPVAKALFQELNKIEPEIKLFIENESRLNLSAKHNYIELKINDAVNNYLRRSDLLSETGKVYKEYTLNSYYKKLPRDYKVNLVSPVNSQKNVNTPNCPPMKSITKRERNNKITIKVPDHKSGSSSINIKIDNENFPQTDISGIPLRSIYRDNNIIIFQKHLNFQEKLPQSRKDTLKINDKIIHYIAMEIITHLYPITENIASGNLFVKFASYVYELEKSLYSINGNKII
ncbi:MAG TPA: ATP-binding protein [Ignavibacteria bacterium]|nr:ATP-binding protein [Ignavibacteria bacterium]